MEKRHDKDGIGAGWQRLGCAMQKHAAAYNHNMEKKEKTKKKWKKKDGCLWKN